MASDAAGSLRMQSAMEYLTTYGWAILVVAVVMAVLLELGVFGSPNTPAGCIASSGYTCSSPLLESNGLLTASLGSARAMNITDTGCSQNESVPSNFIPESASLANFGTAELAFSCTLNSGSIGAPFAGTLWIKYSQGSVTGLVSEVASIGVKVTANSIYSPSNVVEYVPITITNSQSSATPAGFQDMLTIASSSYSSYINSAWSNVEFTTSAAATGSTIPAWVESGNTNTASSTIVWVNLPASIPANGNTVIYMDFMPTNVMSASGPTGEAPQLSPTYGEYDDGASVFMHYGGGGSAGWSQFTFVGGSWTTSNGYLQQTSVSGNYGGGPAALIESTSYPASGNYVLGMAFNYTTEATARAGIIAVAAPTPGPDTVGYRFIGQQGDNGAGFISFLNDLTDWVASRAYPGTVSTDYTLVITDAGGSWSGALYNGYGTETSTALTTLPPTSYTAANHAGNTSGYVGISASYYTGSSVIANPINVTWFYMRAYPPNGVMPSLGFGAVQSS